MNTNDLARLFKTVKTSVIRHSPELLTGIGIAGMITSTVLAVKATPKALALIEEEKERQTAELIAQSEDDDSVDYEPVTKLKPMDVVKVTWKCYIPAAVTCVTSAMCIICSNAKHLRRNAALATAYKISETTLAEYREKVVETIGEKKEKEVRDKVAKSRVEKHPVSKNEVIITEKGNTLCLDPISKRYFKSDIERIRRAENKLNKQMLHDITGYVSLNEFYGELGLDYTMQGDDLGWNTDNLIDIDFSSTIAEDGTPCIVLDFTVAPKYHYDRLY